VAAGKGIPEAAFPLALGVADVPGDIVLVVPGAGVLEAPGAGALDVPGAGVLDVPGPETGGRAQPTDVPPAQPVRTTAVMAKASAGRDISKRLTIVLQSVWRTFRSW